MNEEEQSKEIIKAIDDAMMGKKTERINVTLPHKFDISFTVAHREYWTTDDVVEVLSELIEFLKAPVEEDTEIF
jgi:hypothetical protein